MTDAPSLAFPGSRKLAGWWRQLTPFQPRALWVGYLLLHHVEALVRLAQPCPLEPLARFLLRALVLEGADPARPDTPEALLGRLEATLHLGRGLLRQALRGLEAEGLIHATQAAPWEPTDRGRQALERGDYPRDRHERRTFWFLDPPAGDEGRGRPPRFLAVHNSTGIPWPPAETAGFDVRALEACVRQPPEWKQSHGFPAEVQEVLLLTPEPETNVPPPWRRVVIDRPEQVTAALVLTGTAPAGPRLVGLAVNPDGWVLHSAAPLFTLGADWAETLPELAEEPSLDVWRQALVAWLGPRTLPPADAAALTLERQGERLRVRTPPGVTERLRASRGEIFKGEAWLLAGTGRLRPAARLEIVG